MALPLCVIHIACFSGHNAQCDMCNVPMNLSRASFLSKSVVTLIGNTAGVKNFITCHHRLCEFLLKLGTIIIINNSECPPPDPQKMLRLGQ
jgi:hypothetical protein